jgi:hypothetical protein
MWYVSWEAGSPNMAEPYDRPFLTLEEAEAFAVELKESAAEAPHGAGVRHIEVWSGDGKSTATIRRAGDPNAGMQGEMKEERMPLTPTQERRARRQRTKVVPKCDGKVRHPLRSAAEREARSLGCAAYPCEHCGGWHVGHRLRP